MSRFSLTVFILLSACGRTTRSPDAGAVTLDVEVRAFCFDAGCSLDRFDEASLALGAGLLGKVPQPFAVTTCGNEVRAPPVLTRRVVVFAADGGARSAVDYGIFWRAISVPRVSNADALYVLARDTTVVEVESDVVVDAGVESTTYRYAFADDPTIGVEEVHRVRTSTADVVHQWWLYCPGY